MTHQPYEMMRALLSDRPIAFHPMLARVFGGVYEALLFQQLAFWSDKGVDPDWIYKTRDQINEETTLNRYQQEQARASLRKLGVINEERRGLPARIQYRVNWERVYALLHEHRAVGRPSTNKMAEDGPTGETDPPVQLADHRPTTESTAEKTTKETSGEVEASKIRKDHGFQNGKYDPVRADLVDYIEGYAREFRDASPLSASVTRAVKIFRRSGREVEAFVGLMEQARAVTKERTGAIRAGEGGRKQMMAYWFSVLEDLAS